MLQTGNIILFAYGIRLTLASVGQIIYSITPILVSLMSYYALKEKMTPRKILGIFLGFIGVNLIVFIPFYYNNNFVNSSTKAFLGNLLIFIGCIGYSSYTVLSKKYLKTYSPFWLTISFLLTTALVSLIFAPLEISSFKSLTFFLDTS